MTTYVNILLCRSGKERFKMSRTTRSRNKKRNNVNNIRQFRRTTGAEKQRKEPVPTGTKARFTIRMQKKLAVLFILVLLAFVGLSSRLFLITKADSQKFKKQVLSQQEYKSTVLPYKRGDIIDAKGTKLAYSEKVYNLVVDASIINSKKDYLEPTLNVLSQVFGLDKEEIRKYILENPNAKYHVVKKQLTYEEIQPYLELKEDKKNGVNIMGLWFEDEYKRVYPYNALACDVIGFTGKDNAGTYGLEEYYNDVLNGINGREYGYLNDDSTLERTTKAAIDGKSIKTSIDTNIQKIVEKYIKQFNELHKGEYREGELGSKNTGVIVMDPNNANILAMASYPDFDLNNPKDLTQYFSADEIAKMEEEDKTFDALNQLWRNFCIQDTFEPGSTAKALTISAGLDSGKVKGNEYYTCNGVRRVGGHDIHCHNVYGHNSVSVSGALEQSCNVALMYMGDQLGKATFMKYLTGFNVGLKTNIDLAGEARTENVVFNVDKMGVADLAIATFGQGYNVTMIELANAFCSVINGGNYYEPHMVSEIINADGSTAKTIEPRILKQTISAETSRKMREYLKAVCVQGTGKKAVPAGYVIGGKTGTAETRPRKQGQYVVSFIGYAPADDPQVVVYVVVDRPNVADQPHSDFAQEIAKGIFTEILPYMKIFRTETLSEEQEEELKKLNILDSVSDNSVSDNDDEDKTEEDGNTNQEDNDKPLNYDDNNNATDPRTGYRVDPDTMEYSDPNFSPIDGITGTPSENTDEEDNGDNSRANDRN